MGVWGSDIAGVGSVGSVAMLEGELGKGGTIRLGAVKADRRDSCDVCTVTRESAKPIGPRLGSLRKRGGFGGCCPQKVAGLQACS